MSAFFAHRTVRGIPQSEQLHHPHTVGDVQQFFDLGGMLLEQPKLGRVVPELRKEHIRELFLYSYRLIYELHEQEIQIIAVIHGSRLLLENIGDRLQSLND